MTLPDELIERLAKAAGGHGLTMPARITAALSELHRAGWVVVPAEATPEMIAAGWQQIRRAGVPRMGAGPAMTEVYRAMISAKGDGK